MNRLSLAIDDLLIPGLGVLVVDDYAESFARANGLPPAFLEELVAIAHGPRALDCSLAGVTVRQERFDDLVRSGRLPRSGRPLVGLLLDDVAAGRSGQALRGAAMGGAQFVELRANRRPGSFPRGESHVAAAELATAAQQAQAADILPVLSVAPPGLESSTLGVRHAVTVNALRSVVSQAEGAGVALDRVIVRVNLVAPGARAVKRSAPETVARATLDALGEALPPTVPGVHFMSAGQPLAEVCAQVRAVREMSAARSVPWRIGFAMGRALIEDAGTSWSTGGPPRAAQRFAAACRAVGDATLLATASH